MSNHTQRDKMDEHDRLRKVGYWRSSEDQAALYPRETTSPIRDTTDPWFDDVHEAIDPTWDKTERELVIDYLTHAPRFWTAWGFSPCRLCACQENGSAELTDGTYLWPEGFAHYLVHHSVRPPQHFVEHALANAHLIDDWKAEPNHRPVTVADRACPWRFRWKRLVLRWLGSEEDA